MSNGGIQADGKTFTGDLFRVTGTPFPVSPFVPITQSNVTVVGTMSVTFTSADIGTMTYSVNGAPVVKAIQKQVYGKAAAQCTFTTNSDRSALTNYQDLWWNPNESGWGISLVHQDDILFAALFVYGQSRRDEWYVMSNGPKQADGSFLGDLYRITGPPFNANPFAPLGPDNVASRLTKVGTMSLRFSNGQTGVLTYSVNGVTVVKSIVRQVFGSPVNACGPGVPKLLFMGTISSVNNGGVPVAVINATTGSITDLTSLVGRIASVDGFCFNPVTRNMHISARSRFASVADPQGNIRFPLYNVDTGSLLIGPSMGDVSSSLAPVACATNGAVFYGRGSITANGPSTGVLDVVENGVRTATIALDQVGSRVARRAIGGNTEVYTLNSGPGLQPSSFSVVNIASKSLTRTCQIGSEAFDMDVANNIAYVGVWRDATTGGKDVLLFNTQTCAQTGSIAIPVTNMVRSTYVNGLRVGSSGLYLATDAGVRLYSLTALTQTAIFANPTGTTGAYELALGSNELYATFPDNTIAVLNLNNLSPIRLLTKNVGGGKIQASN